MALWKQRACTRQCPMLALPITVFGSLISYGEMLADGRMSSDKCQLMGFKIIVLSLLPV